MKTSKEINWKARWKIATDYLKTEPWNAYDEVEKEIMDLLRDRELWLASIVKYSSSPSKLLMFDFGRNPNECCQWNLIPEKHGRLRIDPESMHRQTIVDEPEGSHQILHPSGLIWDTGAPGMGVSILEAPVISRKLELRDCAAGNIRIGSDKGCSFIIELQVHLL